MEEEKKRLIQAINTIREEIGLQPYPVEQLELKSIEELRAIHHRYFFLREELKERIKVERPSYRPSLKTALLIGISLVIMAGIFLFVLFPLGSRVPQAFSIVDIYYGNVTIKNEGTTNISSMNATMDGRPIDVLFFDGPIQPGMVGVITLQYIPMTKGNHILRLSSQTTAKTLYFEYPSINVLEVYPCSPLLEQIVANYGAGVFTVISTSMDTFNAGYDISNFKIIVFGFADGYNGKEISPGMAERVKSFVRAGGGLLLSHDTSCSKPGFNVFNDEIGIDCSGSSGGFESPSKAKEGYITKIPYELPEVLTTQFTHTNSGQHPISATIWYWKDDDKDRFYLLTNKIQAGKVALIQYGHSAYNIDCSSASGIPPVDEQKVIINTLWWLAIP